MRLSEIRIRRFKGIPEVRVSMPSTDPELPGSGEFVSIVGENNVGKSSVLQAIQLALPGTGFSRPDKDHFPDRSERNGPIEIEFVFNDLDSEDRQRRGIRTHVYDGEFRLKKEWTEASHKPTYYAYEPDYGLPDWFGSKRTRHTVIEAGGNDAEAMIDTYEAENGEIESWNKETWKELRAIAIEMGADFLDIGEADWAENPGGIKSNVDSALPEVIMIPAIKDPTEETEASKKSTSVGGLVNRLFEDRLIEHDVVQDFISAGEKVQVLFQGEEKDEGVEELEKRITEKVQRMIEIEATLDYDPPQMTSDLAGRTSLELVDEGIQTPPEHQGHGAQRALILSLLEILAEDRIQAATDDEFRRSLLLLMEEPEIYMHPQMLRRMRDVLLEIAKSDTAQVICTTHSPVFLDLADRHDGIVILRADEDFRYLQRTKQLFPEDTVEHSRRRLRMILDFDPSVNEVFFARRVCLVEGDTERAAIEAIARRLHQDGEIDWKEYLDARRFVTVVGCRGKWNICAFQRVLNRFNISYHVVHDTDEGGEEEGANGRIRELQEDEGRILSLDPELEIAFFDDSWDRDKPWRATKRLQEMDGVPDEARAFFEFVLGKSIDSLQAAPRG